MDLLFVMAHWHAMAKLRQHTELSLDILDSLTTQLGQSLRNFEEITCSVYSTGELKREQKARPRKTKCLSTPSNSISGSVTSNFNKESMPSADDLVTNTAGKQKKIRCKENSGKGKKDPQPPYL